MSTPDTQHMNALKGRRKWRMRVRMALKAEDLSAKFWNSIDKNGPIPEFRPDLGPCWIWTGHTTEGYGRFADLMVHKLTYTVLRGPVPDGLTLDHLCRVRRCAHPWHLEAVTNRANTLRGFTITAALAKRTHCNRGHEFSGDNVKLTSEGARRCRTCDAEYWRTHRRVSAY